MAIALTVSEMCEILDGLHLPEYRAMLEVLGRDAARAIAKNYGVKWEGGPVLEMGEAQAAFGPATEGQPMPEIFGQYDNAEEWGE